MSIGNTARQQARIIAHRYAVKCADGRYVSWNNSFTSDLGLAQLMPWPDAHRLSLRFRRSHVTDTGSSLGGGK